MGAGPLCCMKANPQYKTKSNTANPPTIQEQEKQQPKIEIHEVSVGSHQQAKNQQEGNLRSSNEKNQIRQIQKGKELIKSVDLNTGLTEKDQNTNLSLILKGQDLSQKENRDSNAGCVKDQKDSLSKSIANKQQISEAANQISIIQATCQKKKEGSIVCESISRINATLRSHSNISLADKPKKGKKKKGKKKKGPAVAQKQIPHQSYFGNSNTTLNNLNNKTNTLANNESKSIDFQVTYIQKKQESFYKKGNMTNATNFLKSTNITDINLQALKNTTKFINQKSFGEEERIIINDLMGKEGKIVNLMDNSAPDQSHNYLRKRQNLLPNQSSITQKGYEKNMMSPYFNQDDDIITTKQDVQLKQKQYPVIDDIDDFSCQPGDIDEEPPEQYEDEEEPHDDESMKDEVSPNEACYIDVEPIEPSSLIPLNDTISKTRAFKFKSNSKLINGMLFEMWDKNVHDKMKFYTSVSNFKDETMIPIYEAYTIQSLIWKRITEISMNPGIMKEKLQPSKVFAGDASFEATICAITAVINHDIKFSTDFIGQAIYPHNNNKPIPNNFGKYGVRLFVNGDQRIIELDDLILFNSKRKKLAMCYYEQDQNEFSLSLLEKAYLKVYGGFQQQIEANPSIDIHFLTNWIPETVHFDDVSNKENLWTRLLQNFRDQNIIICLQSNPNEEGENNFYSVLDLIESHGLRILQCKAPFKSSPNVIQFMKDTDRLPIPFKREQALAIETGVFYVIWTEDIRKYFTSISLCWNTKIYPFSQSIHSKFPLKQNMNLKFNNDNFSLYNNPQVLFTIPPHAEDFEVRIMLRRHVKDYAQRNTISFKLFTFDGHRIVYPMETLRSFQSPTREICSDVFIFENSTEYESYALVMTAEDESIENCYEYFSLDVFSFIQLDLKELPLPIYEKQYSIEGKWRVEEDEKLLGGSILSHKFVFNPQYRLQVPETTHVQIIVDTDDVNSVMLMLYESGRDATEAPFQAIMANKNQGFFFKGFSFLETVLEPKEYTIVVCPQFQQQKGSYSISVNKIVSPKYDYSRDFQISELKVKQYPYRLEIDGRWTLMNSKGTNRILTDDFQAFMKNPGYVVKVKEPTIARCQLVPTDPIVEGHEIPSVSICIFEILDNFKFRIILEDDHYAGRAWGYFTEEFTLQPNKHGYLFLCINFDRGIEGNYKFIFTSEQQLSSQILDFNDVFYKKHTEQFVGEWALEQNTAGGSSQEPSFYKNPQYLISVTKPTQAIFQLESVDQHPVGMVLFELDKTLENKPISQIEQTELARNPKSNQSFLIEINNLVATLAPNKSYLLVPATYKPNQEGQFILTVSMDSQFTVKVVKEPKLPNMQTVKGRFDNIPQNIEDPINIIEKLPHVWFSQQLKSDLRIQLTSHEEASMKIRVYSINEDQMALVAENKDYSSFRIGALLYIRDLKPNQYGYVILCQQNDPSYTGDFALTMESEEGSLQALIKDYLLSEDKNNSRFLSSRAPIESQRQQASDKKPKKVIKKSSIIRKQGE